MPTFKPITLSKTRFKLALECPRKLDYARDSRYYNSDEHNPMMQSLAEGGHKVGELARRMFPGGILISDRSGADQVRRTADLLKKRNVTIYEATIQRGNLLVRVDILEKKGRKVRLIEVKAKGITPGDDLFLSRKKAGNPVLAQWRPYLYDIAFQDYVFRKAYPGLEVEPYLMFLDKTARIHLDGLNGMFTVRPDGAIPPVSVSEGLSNWFRYTSIQETLNVAREVKLLHSYPPGAPGLPDSFTAAVELTADILERGHSFPAVVGPQCKSCQFYVDPEDAADKGLSGWHACLMVQGAISADARRKDTVFDLHKIRPKALSGYLGKSRPVGLDRIPLPALGPRNHAEDEITEAFRRYLQVQEAHGKITAPHVLKRPLKAALDALEGPLHFLDFETSRPALPWHRGRRPYDQILFQFSHHVLLPSRKLEHRTQCLETTPGKAPSLDVLRALKAALSGDRGRILHWSPFEGSVLESLQDQVDYDKPADAQELKEFIHDLVGTRTRPGRLFDLCKLVSKTVFYPGTGGSSSIKQVLPAVLRTSVDIRAHYGRPIYGTEAMPSHNYSNWTWVKTVNNIPQDPYKRLDPALHGDTAGSTGIADGGAAQMAYDRLQRADLTAAERTALENQLLRYCELDTLAMVMVYQSLTGV